VRRGLLVTALTGAAAAGALWRRRRTNAERVELHFDDGSMIALDERRDDARALLERARDVLDAARA
jgi:hypothetical protein